MNTHATKGNVTQKHARVSDHGIAGTGDERLGRIDRNSSRSPFPSPASKHNESGGDRPELFDDEPVRRNEALHPG